MPTTGGPVPAEATEPISSRPGMLLSLVLLAVIGAYSASPLGDFVWDDTTLIVEQKIVREFQPFTSYFDRMFFGGPVGAPTRSFYRPLVTLSFAADWKIWGGSPLGFHLTNLFLHLACVALVFLLARRWGATPLAAAMGAATFGLFPRLSEAVAWISGRTDLLASVFVLAAIVVHLPRGPESLSALRRWAASLLLFLGLLAKEVAIAGVAAIVVMEIADAFRKNTEKKEWWARLFPPALAVAAYMFLRVSAELATHAPSRSPALDLCTRMLLALEAIGSYAWAFADPLRPRTQIGSIFVRSWPMVALGGVAVIASMSAAWTLRSKSLLRGQAFGLIALGVIPIAVVVHLFPIPLQVAAADRLLYLPSAALALFIAVATKDLQLNWKKPARMAAVLVILTLAASTYSRTLDWQDDLSLWSEAALHAPEGNSLPFVQLGMALARSGRYEEALLTLDRAAAIDLGLARNGVGDPLGNGSMQVRAFTLATMGRLEEARKIFEELAYAHPFEPDFLYNIGVIRSMELDFDGARNVMLGLLRSFPDYGDATTYLELILQVETKWRAIPSDGSPEASMSKAEVLITLGRWRDAQRLLTSIWLDVSAPQTMRDEAARRLALSATRETQ